MIEEFLKESLKKFLMRSLENFLKNLKKFYGNKTPVRISEGIHEKFSKETFGGIWDGIKAVFF